MNFSRVDKEFDILEFVKKQLLGECEYRIDENDNRYFITKNTYQSNFDNIIILPKFMTGAERDEVKGECFATVNKKHQSYMKYGATELLMYVYGDTREQAKNRALRLIKDNYEDKPQEEEVSLQASYILPSKNGLAINVGLLAEHIRNNLHYLVVRKQGSNTSLLYIYEDGYYKISGRPDLIAIIKKYVPMDLRKSSIWNNVYDDLVNDESHLCRFEDLNQDYKLINFKNGILNLDTGDLIPHDPKYKMTIQINCNYTSNFVNNGVFDEYLDTLTNGNKNVQDMLFEFCGLAISNILGHIAKKALSMYGEGNTGKSKLRELVQRLIGTENVCSYDLSKLESNPHATFDLYGKRIYGSGDAEVETARSISVFKCLTGGDSITANPKGKDGFDFTFQGVVWFVSNPMIRFAGDRGEHVYDRFLYAKCENVVPMEKRDKNLVEKMLQEKEYIVCLFVHHLVKLIENNYIFSGQAESEACREEHKRANASFVQFVFDQYAFTESDLDYIVVSSLFRDYEYYCKVNNAYKERRKDCTAYMELLAKKGKIIINQVKTKGKVYRKMKYSDNAIKTDYDMVDGKIIEK